MDAMISSINEGIRPFKMNIVKFTGDESDEPYLVLYNMVDNHITRMSKIHTESELEYFKRVISLIVFSNDGLISKNLAVNARNELHEKNIVVSGTEAENLIARWVNEKYLNESADHEISLGVRSLVELAPYLKEYFPHNIYDCSLCKNICIQGIYCPHLSVKLHNRCAQKYFNTIQNCSECSDNSPSCSQKRRRKESL